MFKKGRLLKTKFCPECDSPLRSIRMEYCHPDHKGKYYTTYECSECRYSTDELHWYNKKDALKEFEKIGIGCTTTFYWYCEKCGNDHEYDSPCPIEEYTVIECEKCGKKVFVDGVSD